MLFVLHKGSSWNLITKNRIKSGQILNQKHWGYWHTWLKAFDTQGKWNLYYEKGSKLASTAKQYYTWNHYIIMSMKVSHTTQFFYITYFWGKKKGLNKNSTCNFK